MNRCTLVFPRDIGRIWLATKMKKVGAGLLNGWGGKFDPKIDKTLLDTVKREFVEESGAQLKTEDHFERVAIFNFFIEGKHIFECHIYFCYSENWANRLNKTDEMGVPEYFDLWGLPLERMMPADTIFLPRLIKGERLTGDCYYTKNNESVEKFDLMPMEEVESKVA